MAGGAGVGAGAGTASITVCAADTIVGAVVTFSTAVETIAMSATFSVNVMLAAANAVTVF